MTKSKQWSPTKIVDVLDNKTGTSTNPVVVSTDNGTGYFKAVENNQGTAALAREFVGTSLAAWFGLSTFKFCLFEFDGKLEIILANGERVGKGTGFMTKEEEGDSWDKTIPMLDCLTNKDDITRLVCFDTWVRNVDRCYRDHKEKVHTNADNVYLTSASKKLYTLKAMDFTHAFLGNLDNTMDKADNVQDEAIYGLFPGFRNFLKKDIAVNASAKLRSVQDETVRPHVESIPNSWNIGADTREAWIRFLVGRAAFVACSFLRLSGLDNSYLRF